MWEVIPGNTSRGSRQLRQGREAAKELLLSGKSPRRVLELNPAGELGARIVLPFKLFPLRGGSWAILTAPPLATEGFSGLGGA